MSNCRVRLDELLCDAEPDLLAIAKFLSELCVIDVCVVCGVCHIGLPEPLYKTVYVDSATLKVRLADSAAEPTRQFYVQYRPTGETLCQLECADSFCTGIYLNGL